MEPQAPTPPATDPSQSPMPPVPAQPRSKKPLMIAGAVILVLAIAGTIAVYALKANSNNNAATRTQTAATNAPEPKVKAEQVLTNPADSSKVAIEQNDYYSLVVGSATYYGPLLKINDAYVRMTPTAYKNQGTLIFTGNELNGPEPATFFQTSNISSVHKLSNAVADEAAIIKLVKPEVSQASYAYPSDKIDSYLEASHLQAFVFKDGMTLFAKASTLQGNFLSGSKHVYYIANTNGQVSLTVAKTDQYASRTSSDLLYWQNLKSDGKVAKAIADYEKANP